MGREPWPISGRTCPCPSHSCPHPLVKVRQRCKGHLVLMCLIKSFTFLRCCDGFTVLTRQDPLPPHPAPFTGHRVLSEDAPSDRGRIYHGHPLPLPRPSYRPRRWDHDLCASVRRRHSVSVENVPATPTHGQSCRRTLPPEQTETLAPAEAPGRLFLPWHQERLTSLPPLSCWLLLSTRAASVLLQEPSLRTHGCITAPSTNQLPEEPGNAGKMFQYMATWSL